MTAAKERRDDGTTTGGEYDGRALASSLAFTLLELGMTLTASFLLSRWIARMIHKNGQAGGG